MEPTIDAPLLNSIIIARTIREEAAAVVGSPSIASEGTASPKISRKMCTVLSAHWSMDQRKT